MELAKDKTNAYVMGEAGKEGEPIGCIQATKEPIIFYESKAESDMMGASMAVPKKAPEGKNKESEEDIEFERRWGEVNSSHFDLHGRKFAKAEPLGNS